MKKLTKTQQRIITEIKANGRVWINGSTSPSIFNSYMKLADAGILWYSIDNGGIWFDLV
jgi:hypothetical protein